MGKSQKRPEDLNQATWNIEIKNAAVKELASIDFRIAHRSDAYRGIG